MFTGHVYATLPTALLFSAVFSKYLSSHSTNVCNALEASVRMRYINTLHVGTSVSC